MSHVKQQHDTESKTTFGFWVYIMTDCVLFATLFATYAVLRNSTDGGPGGSELFELPFVLVETMILLTSSFICGIAMLAARAGKVRETIGWLIATALLGISFIAMELHEFTKLYNEGNSWRESAFLSAFFTLVATHGIHITIGLIWLAVLLFSIRKRGITKSILRKLSLFSLFWHFLDIIWIFIFTIVYLFGASSL